MKVVKNYLYNASYQILNLLIPLITVPYISRVLGAHDVGINEYTNSWVTFFYLMGQMGITLYGNRGLPITVTTCMNVPGPSGEWKPSSC